MGAITLMPAQGLGQPEATAEIRIGLPAGDDPKVTLSMGLDRLSLDLPEAARFPSDFSAASNGILGEASVEREDDRVRIELTLSAGRFERIDYQPDAVVLFFESYAGTGEDATAADRYILGPDDRVSITVHNQEDLTRLYQVDREGRITLAHVGEVAAAGLTPRQLEARLTNALNAILVNPRVDVEVEEYRSQWVIVSGEINRQGRIPLRGGTRLKEVLGEAEGFTDYAGEEISISRRVLGTDGTVTMVIDRTDYESGRKNPTLQNGDIVEVKRADYCYIQGEVRDSNRVRIERGMTLLRVISLAGGLTDWADKKNVKVRRTVGNMQDERIYNIKKILNGKEQDPVMRGGEVIIVPRRFL